MSESGASMRRKLFRLHSRLEQEAAPHAIVEFDGTFFHPIRVAVRRASATSNRQIEDEREIGFEPAGRHSPNRPEVGRGQPTGVPLVDDVRQREPIRDDHLAASQRGADDFFDQLRPRRHEQERLGRRRHSLFAAMEEELPQFPAERRAARIGTSRNRDLLPREPVDEQPALGRFPGAVETIERKEYRFRHFLASVRIQPLFLNQAQYLAGCQAVAGQREAFHEYAIDRRGDIEDCPRNQYLRHTIALKDTIPGRTCHRLRRRPRGSQIR